MAADGTLYVNRQNLVIALNSDNGEIQWNYIGDTDIRDALTIAPDGDIVYSSGHGESEGSPVVALKGGSPLANTAWPKSRADLANSGSARRGTPHVSLQPADIVAFEGDTVELHATVWGSTPLRIVAFAEAAGQRDISGASAVDLD